MTILLEGQEPAAVKKAINHFYTYIAEIDDEEIRTHLADIVENNAESIDELTYTSGWISGIKVIGWLAYIVLVIMALILGGSVFRASIAYGLGIMIGVPIMGFIGIAGPMIFIDIAEDIRYIRNQISKKK